MVFWKIGVIYLNPRHVVQVQVVGDELFIRTATREDDDLPLGFSAAHVLRSEEAQALRWFLDRDGRQGYSGSESGAESSGPALDIIGLYRCSKGGHIWCETRPYACAVCTFYDYVREARDTEDRVSKEVEAMPW